MNAAALNPQETAASQSARQVSGEYVSEVEEFQPLARGKEGSRETSGAGRIRTQRPATPGRYQRGASRV